MPVMTREQFNAFVATADLGDRAVCKQINSTVIDEVLGDREVRQHWEVNGFPPLDTFANQVLRPCPKVVLRAEGRSVVFVNEWFCD